jgi:WD40 repeat protein
MALAISPDNKYVASGEYSSKAYLWNITSRRKVSKIVSCSAASPDTYSGSVSSITFSRDGRLFTGCSNGAIRAFDPEFGKELLVIQAKAPIEALYLSDNDEKICTIEPLFKTKDGEIVHSIDNDRHTYSFGRYCMRFYSVASGKLAGAINEDDPFSAAALTPNRQQLAALHDHPEENNNTQTITVYSMQSGEELAAFNVSKSTGTVSISFDVITASNELITIGGWKGEIRLYCLETDELVRTIPHEGDARGILFSSDGKILAVSIQYRHDDLAISLYDTNSGEELMKIDDINSNWGLNMAFSPDGKLFTSAGVKKGEKTYGND